MKRFKLYDYWRSSAAFRVRIALNLKAVEYEQISIHLVKDGGEQHSACFHQCNPQERVPVLEMWESGHENESKVRLTQSMAIMDYLNVIVPEPSFYPDDLILKAKVHGFALAIACDIHPLNNLGVLQYLTGTLGLSDEAKQQWYQYWIANGFQALEEMLRPYSTNGDYCFGKMITMADICLVPQVYNALRFHCPMESYPRIQAIYHHCLQQEAFSLALPEKQKDAVET